jgi:hypothetical protein
VLEGFVIHLEPLSSHLHCQLGSAGSVPRIPAFVAASTIVKDREQLDHLRVGSGALGQE